MSFNGLNISEHRLDNGLKIILCPYYSVASASFMVWYGVGSRTESVGKTGISHFLEHLSFKKTELFDYGQLVHEINKNGGNFNAYTSRDYTCYYETFTSDKLELAAIIESQRMKKLKFDDDDRKTEIGVILSEMEKNFDNPYSELENSIRKTAYHHHPYKNPIIGIAEDVKAITYDDLYSYYDRYYVPNNATVVVTGNFNTDETIELIKKYFGDYAPGSYEDIIKSEPEQKRVRNTKIAAGGSTSIIEVAYHIPSIKSRDIYPLIVLGELLNIGVSSRMYQDLIESEISTDIKVNAEVSKDPGLFTILSTLYPKMNHEKAQDLILGEIEALQNGKPPTKEEIEKTIKRINSSFEYNKDGTLKLAYILGYYDTVHDWTFAGNYLNEIAKVTPESVAEVAKKYLVKDNSTIGHFIPHHEPTPKLISAYSYSGNGKDKVFNKSNSVFKAKKIQPISINFNKRKLNNGLTTLISQSKTSNTVKLYGTINAGNLYNATGNPTLPFMCAGMLNRGSKKHSKKEISREVESRGASVGISKVRESVDFALSSTTEDFPYVLELLAEILREPIFPEDEFNKLKKFSIAVEKQKKNNSSYLAHKYFTQLIYPVGHPWYVYSGATQQKHIKKIFRNDISEFYNRYYSPNTTIIAAVGNIDTDATFGLIEKFFGDWQPFETPGPKSHRAFLQQEEKIKTVFAEHKTESKVVMGHYVDLTRENPDFHKALIINFVLAGNTALSGRLGQKLRERMGLVYNINSSFSALAVPGSWAVRFGTDEENTPKAINAVKEELVKLKEFGITDEELATAKSYLTGYYPLKFSNNSSFAKSLLINEYYNLGDDYINSYPVMIDTITKEEVNNAIQKYIHPDKLSVVTVKNRP